MKKSYISPEFEVTKLVMESIMQSIAGSENEFIPSDGDELG